MAKRNSPRRADRAGALRAEFVLESLDGRRMFAVSLPKLGDVLGYLATDFASRPEAHQSRAVYRNKTYALASAQPNKGLVRTAGDTVMVKAVSNNKGGKKLAAQLEAIGAAVTGVYGVMVSANVPVSALAGVQGLTALNYADASYAPITSAGRTDDYGEQAMNSDRGRHRYAVDGTGVTVGVISDSFNNKTSPFTTAANDVATGDLPAAGVNVLQEAPSAGSDEGRAMAQIVHDVAPGAAIAFHSANVSEPDFAAGILELAKPVASGGAGAKVVVDDVRYYDEPFFQDGIVAQAVTSAYNTYGTSYFSSAGNQANESYEAPFVPTASITIAGAGTGVFQDFDTSAVTNVYQAITVPAGTQIILSMQWDAPYASASANAGGGASPTNSVGLYLINSAKTALLSSSTTSRVGGDAYQVLGYTNSGASAITAYVAMKVTAGAAPTYIKHVLYNGTIVDFDTNSPTASGHNIAPGSMAVAAAFYNSTPAFNVSPPQKESFTSLGGGGIRFNANGSAKASPEIRNQPAVTGPDGAATTFFSSQLTLDAQYHFFGTSSAAPHVAAVAALLLQSKPTLTNAQVYTALQNNTIDMAGAGFDFETGYGLVQADKALDSVSASSISGTTFRDLNNNGVKDGSDTFVTGQSVFLDQNNNGVLDTSSGTVSGSPAQAIPDAGATFSVPSRVSTTLATSFGGRVTGLTVSVNATHTYASDLGFTLITPSGARIPLSTVIGLYNGGGGGVNVTFSDAAATYIQSNTIPAGSLTGTYKPQTPLAQAIGENATGTWTLESRDYTSGDTGTLNSWSLTLNYADPSTTTDGSGAYAFSALPPSTFFGTYRVRVAGLAGFTQTVPASPYDLTLPPSTTSSGRNFAFASAASTIATIVLDDGTTQRSRIRKMDVTILGTVPAGNILAGAFTLTQTSGPVIQSYGVTVTGVTTPVAGQTKISLAFTGAGVVATSVADGRFTLNIDGTKITNSSGVQLDALGNGVAGSVRPYLFYRLFGDYDGDAGVSINDFNTFAPTFGSVSPAAAFKSPFDYDGDNGISINDFNQFAPRFGKTI